MAIITITRGSYGGVEALARRLADDLGYRLFSREEVLEGTVREYGLSPSQLESALMHRPGFLEGRGLKRLHYIACAQAVLANVAREDNLVYHGEAGHVLLKGIPHHVRVRVVADMEFRIGAVMERCELSRDKAIQYIADMDRERNTWLKWVHGVDANDLSTYDLVVNLERFSIPSAAVLIAQVADRDFRTTRESQRMMDDLALTSELRARAGLEAGISDDRIGIEASDGVVTITANVRHLVDATKVEELARRLSGVRDVRSDIDARWRE